MIYRNTHSYVGKLDSSKSNADGEKYTKKYIDRMPVLLLLLVAARGAAPEDRGRGSDVRYGV